MAATNRELEALVDHLPFRVVSLPGDPHLHLARLLERDPFDYVILSQTLQAMRRIEAIVAEMLRVGREAIITFPNFGHWSHRLQVLRGRMPVSTSLPYQWYDTPNIHLCTVTDFDVFLARRGYAVEDRVVLIGDHPASVLPNLRGEVAVYRFRKA